MIASYGLTYAALLISGGRLGDIYGRKRMFIWGVTAFTMASILCGLAPSPVFLIAARALQGVSGALLFPQVLAIMQVTFPQSEKSEGGRIVRHGDWHVLLFGERSGRPPGERKHLQSEPGGRSF